MRTMTLAIAAPTKLRERCAGGGNHRRGQHGARKHLRMTLEHHAADCAAHRVRIQADGKRLGSGQNDALHEGFQILNIISKMIDMR